jgi:hypothetical protein
VDKNPKQFTGLRAAQKKENRERCIYGNDEEPENFMEKLFRAPGFFVA